MERGRIDIARTRLHHEELTLSQTLADDRRQLGCVDPGVNGPKQITGTLATVDLPQKGRSNGGLRRRFARVGFGRCAAREGDAKGCEGEKAKERVKR
jgi:hypothetical protein